MCLPTSPGIVPTRALVCPAHLKTMVPASLQLAQQTPAQPRSWCLCQAATLDRAVPCAPRCNPWEMLSKVMEVFSGGEDCRLPYGGSLLLKLGALDASLLSPPSPPWLPLQECRCAVLGIVEGKEVIQLWPFLPKAFWPRPLESLLPAQGRNGPSQWNWVLDLPQPSSPSLKSHVLLLPSWVTVGVVRPSCAPSSMGVTSTGSYAWARVPTKACRGRELRRPLTAHWE